MVAFNDLNCSLTPDEHARELRRAVVAATVGTTIEWYDFLLYNTMAGLVFGKLFFPNQDPVGQQILLRYDPYPVDEIRPRQIVGIVGNVKHFGVGEEAPPFIYAPF